MGFDMSSKGLNSLSKTVPTVNRQAVPDSASSLRAGRIVD